MERIHLTAQGIHSNTSEIEGIAFQTNILTLIAAVAAAHAGEQRRGFAFFAGVVRALAQRSAHAAHEINTLIKNPAEQFTDAMAHAVPQASGVMREISGASQEQNAGNRQINSAVAQLGSATQQNAALVEEAVAAAQSPDERAQKLAQHVQRFDL
jgi:methyl-accepting chemotaxis protein